MLPNMSMLRLVLLSTLATAGPCLRAGSAFAQAAPPATPAPARATPQRGTVKAIDGNVLTLTSDTGQQIAITVPSAARIQRLAPGSTDLKTAEAAAVTDVAVGDRVLVTGSAGDSPATFTAARVILMKSSDIAQKHEVEQQDWQRRGTGGIVSAVDPAGVISISSGARKLQVVTTSTTSYRRYADGSVKFEDAKPGTLSEIRPGDQLLARGAKSDDGGSLQAEEVVSGSFKNLSGAIVSIDAANNTVSLKDLVTKRDLTVHLTESSALHRLPPETAARLAARSRSGSTANTGQGGAAGSGGSGSGGAGSGAGTATARPADASASDADHTPGTHRAGGGDLSQIVARLPPSTLADLHAGDAVMIVAEQSSANSSNLTAITLLAGVEPLLAAASSGSTPLTLSPWSVGGGSPDGSQ